MAHHSRKEDKELVQAILGGEMRNAWESAKVGESCDMRSLTSKAKLSRTVSRRYRDGYDRIFGRK